jgi:hypothetical protein
MKHQKCGALVFMVHLEKWFEKNPEIFSKNIYTQMHAKFYDISSGTGIVCRYHSIV